MKLTIDDVLASGGCAKGTLAFLKRYNLDYRKFFQDGGLPFEAFNGIDDEMLRRAMNQARKREEMNNG